MSRLTLVIGNKNYSSWSLRAWLGLAHAGIDFREILIPLDRPDTAAAIRRHSPSGRVPALLLDDATVVWDSLAILETLAERHPEAGLWPVEAGARAVARSVSAEMHSGFQALREGMPMNIRKFLPGRGQPPAVLADVQRIITLWADCRSRFGASGPFLFGHFGIADAMYAPVVTRFRSYGVSLPPEADAYAGVVMALPTMQAWCAAAREEPWVIHREELA